MNILTTNLSHTAQRFAPAKMLVMIGVHGGITLVLRADLHTLTARHIPVHGKTRACMALASTDSWAGGLPHVREAGLRIMTATVFGVGPGAGPDLGGVQLERGNRIVGRRRPCLHRCEPHRHLAVSTACQQQRQGTGRAGHFLSAAAAKARATRGGGSGPPTSLVLLRHRR